MGIIRHGSRSLVAKSIDQSQKYGRFVLIDGLTLLCIVILGRPLDNQVIAFPFLY